MIRSLPSAEPTPPARSGVARSAGGASACSLRKAGLSLRLCRLDFLPWRCVAEGVAEPILLRRLRRLEWMGGSRGD